MRSSISRYSLSIFCILILLAALVAVRASAASTTNLTVQIPFDFTVAGETLPAGKYFVTRTTLASAEGILLRGVDNKNAAFVLTLNVQSNWRQQESKLVFNRYQGQYFLSKVWILGETTGRELIKSGRERALEQEIARTGAKPERIALVVPQK